MTEIAPIQPPQTLDSERVIINAPMSLAGAAQRSWRLRGTGRKIWLTVPLVLCLMACWWMAVIAWYVVFSVALIPYRLLRRGARKRKAEALRHREMLNAIDKR